MVSPLERMVVGEAVIMTTLRIVWIALRQVGWISAVSWWKPWVHTALPWVTLAVFIAGIGMVGSSRHRRARR